jgi:hypothetical protein
MVQTPSQPTQPSPECRVFPSIGPKMAQSRGTSKGIGATNRPRPPPHMARSNWVTIYTAQHSTWSANGAARAWSRMGRRPAPPPQRLTFDIAQQRSNDDGTVKPGAQRHGLQLPSVVPVGSLLEQVWPWRSIRFGARAVLLDCFCASVRSRHTFGPATVTARCPSPMGMLSRRRDGSCMRSRDKVSLPFTLPALLTGVVWW